MAAPKNKKNKNAKDFKITLAIGASLVIGGGATGAISTAIYIHYNDQKQTATQGNSTYVDSKPTYNMGDHCNVEINNIGSTSAKAQEPFKPQLNANLNDDAR